MPKVFTVSFSDNETMPERIEAMAADLGITSEMLIRRALAEHLGGYGLQEVPLGTKVNCRRRSNIDQVYRLNFDQGR